MDNTFGFAISLSAIKSPHGHAVQPGDARQRITRLHDMYTLVAFADDELLPDDKPIRIAQLVEAHEMVHIDPVLPSDAPQRLPFLTT